MKNNKWEKFDNAVLSAITNEEVWFSDILLDVSSFDAFRFVPDDCRATVDRIIDRRLQALRKAGKIRFSHKTGWSIDARIEE